MKRWLEKLYWDGIMITLIMALVAILLMLRLHLTDTESSLNAVLHAASLWTLESNADLQEQADSIATVSPPIRVTFLMDTAGKKILKDEDGAVCGVLAQNKQGEDIRSIKEEQKVLTSGVLACLKGLKEQGCDGPVTDAIRDIEGHLNREAHR